MGPREKIKYRFCLQAVLGDFGSRKSSPDFFSFIREIRHKKLIL